MRELACSWLHHPVGEEGGGWSSWYSAWSGHIPQHKRKLYIGGIFPMSGTKYVAPELALGNFLFSLKISTISIFISSPEIQFHVILESNIEL